MQNERKRYNFKNVLHFPAPFFHAHAPLHILLSLLVFGTWSCLSDTPCVMFLHNYQHLILTYLGIRCNSPRPFDSTVWANDVRFIVKRPCSLTLKVARSRTVALHNSHPARQMFHVYLCNKKKTLERRLVLLWLRFIVQHRKNVEAFHASAQKRWHAHLVTLYR